MTSVVHTTATLRSHNTEKEERQQNKRLSAHQSATRATQDLNSKNILPVSDTHHKACLKHFHSSMDQNQICERDEVLLFLSLLLSFVQSNRHLLHTITAMRIWASPSRLTYEAENSLHIHALPLAVAISPSTPQRCRLSEYLS